jgi:hypothetical protein
MKLNTILLIGAVVILVFILYRMYSGGSTGGEEPSNENPWIVYGTMSCGWTRKQIDELKSKNVRYEFVDCTNDGACGDIHAFPTNKKPDGTMVTGFIEAN